MKTVRWRTANVRILVRNWTRNSIATAANDTLYPRSARRTICTGLQRLGHPKALRRLVKGQTTIRPPHQKRADTRPKAALVWLALRYSPAEIAVFLNKQIKGVEVDLSKTLYRYIELLTNRPRNALNNWRDAIDWLEIAG